MTLKLEDFEPVAQKTYGAWDGLEDVPDGSVLYTASHMQQLIEQCNALQAEVDRYKASPAVETCRKMIKDKAVIEASDLHQKLTSAQADNERLQEQINVARQRCLIDSKSDTEARLVLQTTSPSDALREHDAKLAERIAQVIQPEDSYQDEWFKAKADCYKRVMEIADKIRKGKF